MSNLDLLAITSSPSSFEARVQQVITSSGIEIWLLEDYTLPIFSLSFAFQGGATQDPAGKPGVMATLAGLLGKGAGQLDAAAFQQALDDDAIEMSFGAGPDSFFGQMRAMSDTKEHAFDLLATALRAPRLDPDAVRRQHDQAAAALKQALNDPGQAAARRFRAACYGDHPYGRSVVGDLDTLATITGDDVAAISQRILARSVLKIACVGAIGPAVLGEAVERTFGSLPEMATLSTVPNVSIPDGDSLDLARLNVPQSTILFGRQGLSRDDPDFDAATVVNHCLGSGMTSRLFKEVREKRGLCYSIGTQNQARTHAALFAGQTATSNERVGEAIAVIRDQIRQLAENGLGPDELDRAKRYLTGSYALQFDTSAKISNHLRELQLQGRGISRLDTRNAAIEAVTIEDAARAAARLVGNGDMLIAIAGKPAGY